MKKTLSNFYQRRKGTIKLICLYAMVFAFGFGFGTWKNHTWDFSKWGFYSSKYVAIWWTVMGAAVTAYRAWLAMNEDENERIKANGGRVI